LDSVYIELKVFFKEYSSQANWKAQLVSDLSSGSLKLYQYILSLSGEVTGNSPLAIPRYLPLILPLFEEVAALQPVTVESTPWHLSFLPLLDKLLVNVGTISLPKLHFPSAASLRTVTSANLYGDQGS
jgi:hypothetical protein